MISYYSTNSFLSNSTSSKVSFKEALFKGIADDNGLFMPDDIPVLPFNEIVDMSEMPRLTSYLLALGYTDKQIQSILGGNALRVLRESWGKQ